MFPIKSLRKILIKYFKEIQHHDIKYQMVGNSEKTTQNSNVTFQYRIYFPFYDLNTARVLQWKKS